MHPSGKGLRHGERIGARGRVKRGVRWSDRRKRCADGTQRCSHPWWSGSERSVHIAPQAMGIMLSELLCACTLFDGEQSAYLERSPSILQDNSDLSPALARVIMHAIGRCLAGPASARRARNGLPMLLASVGIVASGVLAQGLPGRQPRSSCAGMPAAYVLPMYSATRGPRVFSQCPSPAHRPGPVSASRCTPASRLHLVCPCFSRSS